MEIVYHLSKFEIEDGYLDPDKSNQDPKRVHTSTAIESSILHASEGKDSSIQVYGKNAAFERFEEALKKEFENNKLFIYEIDAKDSLIGQFDEERVFVEKKKIENKIEYSCGFKLIKELEAKSLLKIDYYPGRPDEFRCKCGINDKDLLLKELINLVKEKKSLIELRGLSAEFPHLKPIVEKILMSQNLIDELIIFCHPSVSKGDWTNLIKMLCEQEKERRFK